MQKHILIYILTIYKMGSHNTQHTTHRYSNLESFTLDENSDMKLGGDKRKYCEGDGKNNFPSKMKRMVKQNCAFWLNCWLGPWSGRHRNIAAIRLLLFLLFLLYIYSIMSNFQIRHNDFICMLMLFTVNQTIQSILQLLSARSSSTFALTRSILWAIKQNQINTKKEQYV